MSIHTNSANLGEATPENTAPVTYWTKKDCAKRVGINLLVLALEGTLFFALICLHSNAWFLLGGVLSSPVFAIIDTFSIWWHIHRSEKVSKKPLILPPSQRSTAAILCLVAAALFTGILWRFLLPVLFAANGATSVSFLAASYLLVWAAVGGWFSTSMACVLLMRMRRRLSDNPHAPITSTPVAILEEAIISPFPSGHWWTETGTREVQQQTRRDQ